MKWRIAIHCHRFLFLLRFVISIQNCKFFFLHEIKNYYIFEVILMPINSKKKMRRKTKKKRRRKLNYITCSASISREIEKNDFNFVIGIVIY